MDTGPDPNETRPQLSRSSGPSGDAGGGGAGDGDGGVATAEPETARAGPRGGGVREALFPSTGPWWNRWRLPLGLLALGLAVVAFFLAVFVFFYATSEIPPPDDLAVPQPSVFVSAQEEAVTTLDPAAVRGNVDLEGLPEHVPQAVMAAEDRRFYDHGGFDFRGIVRAAWANVTAGEVEQGASTITQQLVNVGVMDEDADRNLMFKLREIALAVRMEQEYRKDQIFELYLNAVPFGRGAIGIEAGAQTYYQKPAHQIDVNEAATLAGMIAAPSAWDPVENPEAADGRRRFVINGMAERGWLPGGERSQLLEAGLPPIDTDRPVEYGYSGYYVEAVRNQVEEIFAGDPEREDVLVGLRVHTHMDQDLQSLAQEVIASRTGAASYSGALVSIDPSNGAVVAMVGGPGYDEQEFNSATQALRQPGSAFKTFGLLGYIDAGNSPSSTYPAPSQIEVDFGSEYGGDYEVSNFADQGFGALSVREATENSVNTVYIQMANEIGPDSVREAAVGAGIRDDEENVQPVPSLILGTASVSVLGMAEAYATLAAEGVHREPQLIRRIDDLATGETLWEAQPQEEERFDPNVANVVTDVLTGVVERGTGTSASIGRPAAGKTGTTDDNRDAWFVGYVPQLVTAVWIGNLDNSPMGSITGGDVPAPIWRQYMSQAVAGMDVAAFTAPDLSGLRSVREADPDRGQQDEETDSDSGGFEPEPEPEPVDPEPVEPEGPGDEQEPGDETGNDGTDGPGNGNGNGNGDTDDGVTGIVEPNDEDEDGGGNGGGNGGGGGGGNGGNG